MSAKTEIPKPQHVAGYVRNKKEIEAAQRRKDSTDKANTIMAAGMVGYIVIMLAVLFWKVTVSLAILAAAGYFLKRYIKRRMAEPHLKVNYYEGYSWQKRWANVIGVSSPYRPQI